MIFSGLLPAVEEIARKAGEFIRQERINFSKDAVQIKGTNDLVSYVDKTAEKLIIDELKKITPEAGFIAEESPQLSQKEWNWIIDPLDGTTNFIHGIPCYAVSIALTKGNEIKLGVVYEVCRDECFSAIEGGRARLNGKPIQVSQSMKIKDSLIATGFPIMNFDRLDAYLDTIRFLMQNSHGLRRIGSAAVDLCYVACGRVDAFFEYNLNAWDVAAGALIAKESGAFVYDFKGGNNFLFCKEIVAGNKHLEKELMNLITKNFS